MVYYALDMQKTIIFDLYGVLLPDPYANWLQGIGVAKTQTYTDLMNNYDNAKITTDEFFRHLSRLTNIPAGEIQPHFTQPKVVNSPVRAIVEQLQESEAFKLGLLTNSSPVSHSVLREVNLTPLFNEIVISADVGFVKPQSEIFHIILERLGSKPEETIFIDDNADNVASAKSLGLTTHQFKNPTELVEFLKFTLGDSVAFLQ